MSKTKNQYVLSLSYGKDSIACLGAIEQLGWPLDRIVHAEVWATQDIPADLPPMMEFKAKADEWILHNYGIQVEHICATKCLRERESEPDGDDHSRISYEDVFYHRNERGKFIGAIRGFPMQRKSWCKKLKYEGQINIRGYLLSTANAEWSEGTGARAISNDRVFRRAARTSRGYKYCPIPWYSRR